MLYRRNFIKGMVLDILFIILRKCVVGIFGSLKFIFVNDIEFYVVGLFEVFWYKFVFGVVFKLVCF